MYTTVQLQSFQMILTMYGILKKRSQEHNLLKKSNIEKWWFSVNPEVLEYEKVNKKEKDGNKAKIF